jgi:hypothetical protein
MTDFIGVFNDAVKKIEEARAELAKGAAKSDHEAANAIFEAMCAANLHHIHTVESIRQLAMASLLYAQGVLRHDMSAQATSNM